MHNSSPLKSIREKCLECSNRQPSEVNNCPIEDCALYLYRFGTNPNRKGIGKIKNIGKKGS